MLQKLASGFLLLLSLLTISACDQFDLDELRKKAPPSTPDIFLSARLMGRTGDHSLASFTGSYNQQTNVLTYTLTAFRVNSITPAVLRLHRGTPATGGPIAYTFPSVTNGTITLTEGDEELLLEGGLYIEAQAETHDGQLFTISQGTIVRQSPTPAPVPGPQVALIARVNGSQVVPPTASTITGSFDLLYNKDTNVLSYTTSNLFALSGFTVHLHRGTPGTNGPIIVTLPVRTGHLALGEATILEADEALLLSSGTYIDVHSAEFPNGEVRGAVVPL